MLRASACAMVLFVGMVAMSAQASVIATFEYFGSVVFGAPPDPPPTDLNAFPGGGVARDVGLEDVFGNISDFASRVGFGQVTPDLAYGAGADAAGSVAVRSRTQMRLVITNESPLAREALWDFLIFAGGVGLNTPNFSSEGCSPLALDQCDSWLNNLFDGSVDPGDSADLSFSAELAASGAPALSLFSGHVNITGADSGPPTTVNTFSPGFGLTNFGFSNFDYSWDVSWIQKALGLFDPGETKTLTFLTESIVSTNGLCDTLAGTCVTAYAGYGDPSGAGGRVMYLTDGDIPPGNFLPPFLPPGIKNGQVTFLNPGGGSPQPDPPREPPPPVSMSVPGTGLLILAGFWPALLRLRRRSTER